MGRRTRFARWREARYFPGNWRLIQAPEPSDDLLEREERRKDRVHHLLTRKFQPLKRIAIETINGENAPQSPYVQALRSAFEVLIDHKRVNLLPKGS